MKKRLYYSKDFKRLALTEVIKGKKLEDVLYSGGYDISALLKNDKKYCSKLLHKWRIEVCKNNEQIYLLNTSVSDEILKSEIENLNFNHYNDTIMDSMKKKLKSSSEKYKNLKTRITSTYKRKI